MQSNNRVAVVILTGEQRADSDRIEILFEFLLAFSHIIKDRCILILIGHVNQQHQLLILPTELLVIRDVVLKCAELLLGSGRLLCIRPEIRFRHRHVKFLDPFFLVFKIE